MRAKKLEVEVVCFVSEINNADDDVSVCCCTSRALNADFFNGIIGVIEGPDSVRGETGRLAIDRRQCRTV